MEQLLGGVVVMTRGVISTYAMAEDHGSKSRIGRQEVREVDRESIAKSARRAKAVRMLTVLDKFIVQCSKAESEYQTTMASLLAPQGLRDLAAAEVVIYAEIRSRLSEWRAEIARTI